VDQVWSALERRDARRDDSKRTCWEHIGRLTMSAILVAYATKHGSTKEIAEVIGQRLRDHEHRVDVRSAETIADVSAYDAAIIGSAVYMFRWQKEAMNLLKRNVTELRQRPTWLFSSGPTGGSKEADAALEELRRSATDFPAPKEVQQQMPRIAARGHATFAGKAGDEMGGFFERWMPKGDWRDFDTVRVWADSVNTELESSPAPTR
jgi:menaquinone-dependent protoporphyrinogen oxidase